MAEICYWKGKQKSEVDFIVVQGGTPVLAVQVAESIYDPKTKERELRGLNQAYQELGVKDLILITRRERAEVTLSDITCQIETFPFWCLKS